MVVKIQPAAADITSALVYNENKMSSGESILTPEEEARYLEKDNTGHVLATRNVPDVSTLENEFERLKTKNRRVSRGPKVENPTFHMSVNPGEGDAPLDEASAVRFIDELMERLGYGDSPYRIFRHDDTGRTHYHVVGTRIGQDGKKVRDTFENRRCEEACRDMEQKYGFTYGLGGTMPEKEDAKREKSPVAGSGGSGENNDTLEGEKAAEKAKKPFVAPFSKDSDIPLTQQLRTFHAEAMQWYFTTPEQYAAILRYRYNTEVEIYPDGLSFSGLGSSGSPATVQVGEAELGVRALDEMLAVCAATDIRQKKAQRARLEKNVREAAEKAEDWKQFRAEAARKGIILAVSWTEGGEPFGLTWLDRATRCAFKGSETHLTLAWLQDTALQKGWKITRHPRLEKAAAEKKPAGKKTWRSSSPAYHSQPERLGALMALRRLARAGKGGYTGTDTTKEKDEIRYGDERDRGDIVI